MRRLITILAAAALFAPCIAAQQITLSSVAIDAGHGGHDPGAVSGDRKTFEKTVTLDIAKKLSAKIKAEYPDMKVVLTRDRDEFVSLNDRAAIANRKNVDLFISIHINATKSTSPNGYSVHVLGQSSKKDRDLFAYNMDVCKRENSVILLEDDYTTKYQGFDPSDPESFIFMQLMQNAYLEKSLELAQIMTRELKSSPIRANRGVWQDPFYVLWKTSMPAVLVELGFISNKNDLAVLRTEEGREGLAEALFRSFRKYKAVYENREDADTTPVEIDREEEVSAAPASVETGSKTSCTVAPADATVKYGTQIFASTSLLEKNDARFFGYTPTVIKNGSFYKYVIGVSTSRDQALEFYKNISEKYEGAFLVKISDGTLTREKLK